MAHQCRSGFTVLMASPLDRSGRHTDLLSTAGKSEVHCWQQSLGGLRPQCNSVTLGTYLAIEEVLFSFVRILSNNLMVKVIVSSNGNLNANLICQNLLTHDDGRCGPIRTQRFRSQYANEYLHTGISYHCGYVN